MSARNDYPVLAHWLKGGTVSGFNGDFMEIEVIGALDEIDKLRDEVARWRFDPMAEMSRGVRFVSIPTDDD